MKCVLPFMLLVGLASGCTQTAESLFGLKEPAIEGSWGIFGGKFRISTTLQGNVDVTFGPNGEVTGVKASMSSDPIGVMQEQIKLVTAMEETRRIESARVIRQHELAGQNAKIIFDGLGSTAASLGAAGGGIIGELGAAAAALLRGSAATLDVDGVGSADVSIGTQPVLSEPQPMTPEP